MVTTAFQESVALSAIVADDRVGDFFRQGEYWEADIYLEPIGRAKLIIEADSIANDSEQEPPKISDHQRESLNVLLDIEDVGEQCLGAIVEYCRPRENEIVEDSYTGSDAEGQVHEDIESFVKANATFVSVTIPARRRGRGHLTFILRSILES